MRTQTCQLHEGIYPGTDYSGKRNKAEGTGRTDSFWWKMAIEKNQSVSDEYPTSSNSRG